ncbi:cobalt-precorrin-5B (C(1))-methyltransferase CbiD [Pseudodesulfovibrio sp. zrk46]|uniref:cobalt-precorrin-5B (C(1))-methyltransferase CbiD n=1 Tax=Pseudodesulfovibrio sp. zrk46 TaxID=2725288 RepID=UPI0014494258|nr:cobalt-precorrin-5B (C(1))-methyltransferase CbiD [Pseudodesulfovibrio sp. zrk46]QJB56463.1 cobalamin biosynthesis protein CbiD [Pseudodesulfovibrio sp. zrk46]
MTKELRTGRTTGSCATAAAMAGTLFLLTGETPATIETPRPPGGTLTVPIDRYEPTDIGVRVTVIKDGGDDPDATHGHDIQAVVSFKEATTGDLAISLDGGRGVGRATLPGLPIDVGQAAINPDPRKQIEGGVRQAAGNVSGTLTIIIEVPNGEEIAKKTLNPRLGILGGISILGTQGIVKPYSHASWKATIAEGLDVLKAQGEDHAVFTTGRRSERLYLEDYPGTPELALIQAADFFEFSMQAAADRGFSRVTWSLFFGKLVKQAQRLPYTHARTHPVDFAQLADWCGEASCSMLHRQQILDANTARQVLGLLENDPDRPKLINLLIKHAKQAAENFSGGQCVVDYAVYDFDGSRLDERP